MIYYQCRFRQTAPLRIGTGTSEDSDSDVMRDNRGQPFIPGTGIAGVLRTYLSPPEAAYLFGPILNDTDEREESGRLADGGNGYDRETPLRESRVLVSDAVLPPDCNQNAYQIVTRDGVGMNDRGTVLQGAKYDFEVVECEEAYTAVIELPDHPEEQAETEWSDAAVLERVLREIALHGVSFGARTTRGYGHMTVEIRKRAFLLPGDMEAWLRFDPFNMETFGGECLTPAEETDASALRIEAKLYMDGSFSVRRYLSGLPRNDGEGIVTNTPVYGPLKNQRERPVIPGTSWAGCFRHHMRTLAVESGREELLAKLDDLFGVVEQSRETGKRDTVKRKSLIRFGETEVRNTEDRKQGEYTVTRVAVDRFTGAPRNQGLYSSVTAWGGAGELSIQLPADTSEELRRLLAAAINDLHLGLLTAGGESSVGRGLCRIEKLTVNGEDVTEEMRVCHTGYIRSAARFAE